MAGPGDVDMLCDLLAGKDVAPPLAVGLAGERGSGRTFLLRQVERQIEELARAAAEAEAAGRPAAHCPEIVQIRFDAWSPTDTDPWSTLVASILEGLGEPQDGLGQRADERRAVVAALADVRARDIVAELSGDEELTGLRREAAQKLGLSEVNVRELRDLSTDMSRLGGQASAVGRLLMKDGGRRRKVVATGFTMAILGVLGWGLTSGQGRPWGLGLVALVGALVLAAAGVALWVRPVLDTAAEGLDALTKAVAKADAVESAFSEESARREVVLSERLTEIDERGREAEERRDVERLARLLGHDDRRLIVYVDDLDRCEPSRVEAVVHTVRRLLEFPVCVVLAGDGAVDEVVDVPFRLGPMDGASFAGLVRSLATITEAELAAMSGLADMIPTPRATRRFVHVYRLLRASLPPEELAGYLERKEYETVLGLVAAQVGGGADPDPGPVARAPADVVERWGPRLRRFTV